MASLQVQGQPGLLHKILFQNKKKEKKRHAPRDVSSETLAEHGRGAGFSPCYPTAWMAKDEEAKA